MTSIFIDNRIADLNRIENTLAAEETDPESKGVPHSEAHRECIRVACGQIVAAIRELNFAKRLKN